MSEQEQNGSWTDPEFEQAVRETAYSLWESDGRPEGREQEYWFKALEQRLNARNSGDAVEVAPLQTRVDR